MKIAEIDTSATQQTAMQRRVQVLKQQTKQAQQQAKRERANKQLQKAKQAVADANKLAEAISGTREYAATLSVDGMTCKTMIVADGFTQAVRIANKLFGNTNVLVVL